MEQLAIVARLKSGAQPQAAELLANGPPFDLADSGLTRHTVFLTSGEVVFVFEGHEVEWIVDRMVSDPFQWTMQQAFDVWRELIEGEPRVARVTYTWEGSAAPEPGQDRLAAGVAEGQ